MKDNPTSRFKGEDAQGYDVRIPMLLAGYDAMHEMAAAYLRHNLPEKARLLVVGAGTCREIIKLAELKPGWHFTALDPSRDMLDIGYQRLKEKGLDERVEFCCEDLNSLSDEVYFDAAMSMLVMHFIQPEYKPAFLSNIRKKLQFGSPFVLVDLMQTPFPQCVEIQMTVSHQLGVPFEFAQEIKPRFESYFYPLEIPEFKALIEKEGFQCVGSFFQSLGFYGWALSAQ